MINIHATVCSGESINLVWRPIRPIYARCHLTKRLMTYLLIGSVGEGVVMSIMGLSLFAEGVIVIVMAIILLVNGIFSELLNIPLRVWYKKLIPKDKRAKVINIKDLILTVPMVLVFPLIGYLLAHYSEWLTIFSFGFSDIVGIMIVMADVKKLNANPNMIV